MQSPTLLLLAALMGASAQLRPRRVATNAMGDQEEPPTAFDANGLDALSSTDNDPVETLRQLQESLGGEEAFAALGDLSKLGEKLGEKLGAADPTELLKGALSNMAENPMMKALGESSPEIAEALANPELQEKMKEFGQMMGTEEGQALAKGMMEQMQQVLTDPEKLKEGLAQLQNNPMLKELADTMPGLSDVLNDPEMMEQQLDQTAKLFKAMGDPAAMQEVLGDTLNSALGEEGAAKLQEALTDPELQEKLAAMMKGLGGAGGEGGLETLMEAMGGAGLGGGEGGGLGGAGGVDEILANLGGASGGDVDAPNAQAEDDLQERLRKLRAMMGQADGDATGYGGGAGGYGQAEELDEY